MCLIVSFFSGYHLHHGGAAVAGELCHTVRQRRKNPQSNREPELVARSSKGWLRAGQAQIDSEDNVAKRIGRHSRRIWAHRDRAEVDCFVFDSWGATAFHLGTPLAVPVLLNLNNNNQNQPNAINEWGEN